MLAFGARRFLQSLPTVLAAALIVFVLFSVIPGSFATSMFDDGRGMDAELMERVRKELGLDDPLHVRFAHYVRNLAVLDLGTSFRTREPVAMLIANRVWPTFQLVVAAMTLAITLGAKQKDDRAEERRRQSYRKMISVTRNIIHQPKRVIEEVSTRRRPK